MSKYMDNKDGFLEPNTKQYGSHMVMTNVHKPTKKKYINIDTRYRDENTTVGWKTTYNSSTNYLISIPDRITDVKSMSVQSVEIPLSYYNISADFRNNSFQLVQDTTSQIIVIPDGQYTISTAITAINAQISECTGDFNKILLSSINNTIYNTHFWHTYELSGNPISIHFDTDSSGNSNKYNFKSKLGWLLGFRKPSYTIPGYSTSTNYQMSESSYDFNGPRYLYIVIDEFANGNQNSFVTPQSNSLINKNILARIAIMPAIYGGYGSILIANHFNGPLLSNTRSYTNKIDITKLNIQLVNEYGYPVNLNGLDFSFCLEVEHE